MKIALVFPGNLACYNICINQFKKIIKLYDIDVFILYSNHINYVHLLAGRNMNITIDKNDCTTIKKEFGDNLKYLKAIENEPNYNIFQQTYIDLFSANISWFDKTKFPSQINCLDSWNNKRNYMDQFIRLHYITNFIFKHYENKYDYIMRFRIDQYIDLSVINQIINILNSEQPDILHTAMDNCFVVSTKRNSSSFFEYLVTNMGKYGLAQKNNYVLGQEYQFRECLNIFSTTNKLKVSIFFCTISLNIFQNKKYYIYNNPDSTNFSLFIKNNDINVNNFETKCLTFSEFNCFEDKSLIFLDKYNNEPIIFYGILEPKKIQL